MSFSEMFGISEEVKKVEVKEKKKESPFALFSKLFKKQDLADDELEKVNEYLFMNILSNDPIFYELAEEFTMCKIPVKYKMKMFRTKLKEVLTTHRRNYWPYSYPKSTKSDPFVDFLSEHFKVGTITARRYNENMSKEEKKKLKSLYTE